MGYISVAIDKVKNIWASLPGAGYGQHENKLDKLITTYKDAGGTVA
jgi:muramidase (phage lysozyme)